MGAYERVPSLCRVPASLAARWRQTKPRRVETRVGQHALAPIWLSHHVAGSRQAAPGQLLQTGSNRMAGRWAAGLGRDI